MSLFSPSLIPSVTRAPRGRTHVGLGAGFAAKCDLPGTCLAYHDLAGIWGYGLKETRTL